MAEFALPPGCPPFEAEEATVSFGFRGTAFFPEVFVGAGDLEATEATERMLARFQKVENVGGVWRIPSLAKVWGPQARKLLVAVRVEHTDEGKRLTVSPTANFHLWQVRDLDLELRGTVR